MSNLPEFVSSGEVARLIPVVADSSGEKRTASVILSAMRGVHQFRKIMLSSIGVRVGARATVHAWTEIVLKDEAANGIKTNKDRPDGLLVVETGKSNWTALIEAKVANAEIDEDQLTRYLQLAKKHNINAIITISNQFVALPSHHPIKVGKNLTKNVELYHWSWMYLLTQATLMLDGNEVESPDQRFILAEVERYLSHDRSGISRFDSMNKEWKDLIAKVKSNAPLLKSSEEVENTVSSWHQEQRDLCLVMSRKIGQQVTLRLSRSHRTDPQQRLKDDCEELVKSRVLNCELDIPNAAAPLKVCADLTSRTIICSMRLDAPQDKKSTTARVNWLTRQLNGIEQRDIFVKVLRPGRAVESQSLLAAAIENPSLLESEGSNVVPNAFEVFYMVDLAGKFAGSKKFIEELEKAVPHFYKQAGERLRAWVPPAPKIKRSDPVDRDEPDRTETRESEYSQDDEVRAGNDFDENHDKGSSE